MHMSVDQDSTRQAKRPGGIRIGAGIKKARSVGGCMDRPGCLLFCWRGLITACRKDGKKRKEQEYFYFHDFQRISRIMPPFNSLIYREHS